MLFKPSLSQEMDLYAKVLIEHASNVQPGVPVILHCPIEAAAFCHAMVHYAYERGASEVIVEWSDDALTRAR